MPSLPLAGGVFALKLAFAGGLSERFDALETD
jgi:hypothetical protein